MAAMRPHPFHLVLMTFPAPHRNVRSLGHRCRRRVCFPVYITRGKYGYAGLRAIYRLLDKMVCRPIRAGWS